MPPHCKSTSLSGDGVLKWRRFASNKKNQCFEVASRQLVFKIVTYRLGNHWKKRLSLLETSKSISKKMKLAVSAI